MKCIPNENLSHLKAVSHLLTSLGGAADKKTVMAASNARDYTSARIGRRLWWQPVMQTVRSASLANPAKRSCGEPGW
jgi:hypothetical protein